MHYNLGKIGKNLGKVDVKYVLICTIYVLLMVFISLLISSVNDLLGHILAILAGLAHGLATSMYKSHKERRNMIKMPLIIFDEQQFTGVSITLED